MTVFVATRGDGPIRLGPTVPQLEAHEPTTVSADVYTDPARYELERRHVLGARWLLAGRSEQIPDAGSWLTYEGHGETIVVSRQRDGSVSAFHNVCAHRGAAIVTGLAGCGARRFTCPYHGWVYDTRGSLVGIPDRDDFDPDELASACAVAVAVTEWGGTRTTSWCFSRFRSLSIEPASRCGS